MPNAERAYATLDHIIANPKEWNQGQWWCGTAGCFAGLTVKMAGRDIPTDPFIQSVVIPRLAAQLLGFNDEEDLYDACFTGRDGQSVYDSRSVDDFDTKNLFEPGNTLKDLKEIVETVFGPRP